MAANTNSVSINLIVEDKGSSAFGKITNKIKGHLNTIYDSVKRVMGVFFNWKTLLAGLVGSAGLGMLAKSAVGVAAGFEDMKISLDTLTQGRGMQTLNELNEWALKMPVNTEKAVQSFIMMQAMGLQPTIAQMTTLVDTMSALGGKADMLEGIARALGQIATKGKVSAEELMQLAERGVPVFDILREHFGNVETASLDAKDAIAAIFLGLETRFGGQSQKMQSAWSGMITTLKSYWTEFQRLVMGDKEGSLFSYIKAEMGKLLEWIGAKQKSGELKDWAEKVGDFIKEKIEAVINVAKDLPRIFNEWGVSLNSIKSTMEAIASIIQTIWAPIELVGKAIGNTAGWLDEQYRKSGGMGMTAERGFTADWFSQGGSPTPAPSGSSGFGPPPAYGTQQYWEEWLGKNKGSTVNNYFSQSLSKNEITDIATQMARQDYRTGEW